MEFGGESVSSSPAAANDEINPEEASSPKRRRRKKRFRLSMPSQKTKSKLWKVIFIITITVNF